MRHMTFHQACGLWDSEGWPWGPCRLPEVSGIPSSNQGLSLKEFLGRLAGSAGGLDRVVTVSFRAARYCFRMERMARFDAGTPVFMESLRLL
ncbi:hypothetical protein NtRootA4_07840 [Arthrobacter sp. NtRootA4]|nr:hypothetical protein NtRootA4_07840 [Arthrobacter sp. NtRootA4]BCW26409.1 hypothetical protein NtRootC45_10090 [Arthrobacter sp. NtRootC45]BCW30678.1 hypothetical protein NtRootD5_10090 [Arthrobacter sp. NtRootD5]